MPLKEEDEYPKTIFRGDVAAEQMAEPVRSL